MDNGWKEAQSDVRANPRNWRCAMCHAVPDVMGGAWRWDGTVWQHNHGYPIGHVDCEYVSEGK